MLESLDGTALDGFIEGVRSTGNELEGADAIIDE